MSKVVLTSFVFYYINRTCSAYRFAPWSTRLFYLSLFGTLNIHYGNGRVVMALHSTLVLLAKRNTLILYLYFHRTIMFLLLVYRCIEIRHSKSFLQHFSTFVEILLKSCKKITAGICL